MSSDDACLYQLGKHICVGDSTITNKIHRI